MVVNGYINSSIVTLEKRYKLSSKDSSFIASMYDLGCMLVVLPVSIYGNKGHKPMWVGLGSFIMGVGCFIYASPQFLSGKYEYVSLPNEQIKLCSNVSEVVSICNKKVLISELQNFKYFLYAGQFFIGLGSSPLFTLGLAYIEETNSIRTSSMYVGIATAVTAIGPAVGYITLGALLSVYVDLTIPKEYISSGSAKGWIGAWWIGFLIAGFALIILSVPLMIFPKIVYEKKIKKLKEIKFEMATPSVLFETSHIFKSVALNLTYFCVSVAMTLTMFCSSGISTYGPKYFEIVFGLSSSSSAIVVGLISVPTSASGAFIGGMVLHRYNLKLRGTLMFMAISSLVTAPLLFGFHLTCGETKFAGINSLYFGTKELNFKNLTSPCNSDCGCTQNEDSYQPSCSVDSIIYYSPCYAGCKKRIIKNKRNFYGNCHCINVSRAGIQLQSNTCYPQVCYIFYVFLFILGLLLFLTYLRGAPSIMATMRSVNRHELPLALGLQSIVSRVLGSMPGPIVFGAIIDKSCSLWNSKCNEFGQCIKYDLWLFMNTFFILIFIPTFLLVICFIIPRIFFTLD